ncbi:MAG TPA: protein kinase [Thermoanaerobaculia bacterium]|jgi:tetratricopeptide (TPR) repeat protein
MDTAGQWDRIKTLFHRALELPPDERRPFLERESDDESLRERVDALLASHDDDPRFLEKPLAFDAAGLLRDEMIGRTVGAYRIVSEIARGGMGTVYLAERTDTFRKRVALKIVKRGMDTDEIIRRFHYERQVLASLDHPNIGRIIDGGATGDGLPYLVMDYVEGEPIDAWAEHRQPSIADRLSLFLAICDAVSYAHGSSVIHRDLKPSNIVVASDGRPVLLDFGIAKVLDPMIAGGPVTNTALGMRPMTPQYASPEQLRGQTVTTSSDVYSLGVILYELLTGRRLVQLETITPETIAAIADAEPPLPSKAVRALRGDLDNIVLHALEKDPARRYASVDELAADIRRHQQGLPIVARRGTWAYRSGKFVQRHRAAVGVAVVLLIVAIGAVALMLQRRQIAAQRAIATDAASDMVLQVSDAMSRMSGPTEARLQLLERARLILDRVRETGGADRDLDLRIGETNRAMASAYLTLGDAPRAYQRIRVAERALMPLVASATAGTDELSTYGIVELELGDILMAMSKPAEGVAAYDRAIDVLGRAGARSDARPAVCSSHALAISRKADRLYEAGKFAHAETLFRRALAIDTAVLQAVPRDAIVASRQATSQERIADSLYYAGRVDESCVEYRKTLALRRRNVTLDPTSGDLRRHLAVTLQNCGFHAEGSGDTAEAVKLYEEGIQIQRGLLRADPGNRLLLTNLMGGLGQVGSTYGRGGETDRALALFEEADLLAREHRGKYGAIPPVVNATANNAQARGETLARAGRLAEAERVLESARRDFESLYQGDPSNVEHLRSVIWVELAIVDVLRKQRDFGRALPRAVAAVDRARRAATGGQSHDAQELARALWQLGSTRLESGDRAGARAAAEEGVKILHDLRARGALSEQSPGASEYLPALEALKERSALRG